MWNIPPGDYTLFAWEALEPYAYFDPELLGQLNGKGVSVHLTSLHIGASLSKSFVPANEWSLENFTDAIKQCSRGL